MSYDITAYIDAMNVFLRDHTKNKSKTNKPLIRVFRGGYDSNQYISFLMASREFPDNSFIMEYLDNDTVKECGFTEVDIVDWLLACDIHFIITHIHQGLSQCQFDMVKLYDELKRLRNHPGFPNQNYIECPIFTQDKYKYLEILMEGGYCNPTLMITLNNDHNYAHMYDQINRFIRMHDEGVGWVIKPPFSTNKFEVSFRSSFHEIIDSIIAKSNKFSGKIPYVMLQPTMANRKEYKIAAVNLIPKYVIYNAQRNDSSKAFSKKPYKNLLDFASKVLIYFSERCPNAILGGLTRVDVFMNSSGKLVVNELESFEAVYYAKSLQQEIEVTSKCSIFWRDQIKQYL